MLSSKKRKWRDKRYLLRQPVLDQSHHEEEIQGPKIGLHLAMLTSQGYGSSHLDGMKMDLFRKY